MGSADTDAALERVVARVRALRAGYRPPAFEHVPDPDSALFLCAVDHKAGYTRLQRIGGEELRGSALMWAVALQRDRERGGGRLTARALTGVTAEQLADLFRVGGETVTDAERRAALWRELAVGIVRDHDGSATELLSAAKRRLGGEGGLLALLARYRAFDDPLEKKAQLYAKICERRGWFEVVDPERWEVSSDSVLMRLALRCGLVAPGDLATVRTATRSAFKRVAAEAGIPVPVLDDLLWELGREDPDLLGTAGGDLREPPRDPASAWY